MDESVDKDMKEWDWLCCLTFNEKLELIRHRNMPSFAVNFAVVGHDEKEQHELKMAFKRWKRKRYWTNLKEKGIRRAWGQYYDSKRKKLSQG